MTAKHSLASEVARRVLLDLTQARSSRLPTIRSMCRLYGVSLVTMVKAVGLLKERGIVESFGRHGIRVCAKDSTELKGRKGNDERRGRMFLKAATETATSTEKVLDELRRRITDGSYKVGEMLPKVAYFVHSRHLSEKTVRSAYAQLVRENLAHRRGKQWFVGPEPVQVSVHPLSPPVILLLQQSDHWASIMSADRTARFASTFSDEAANAGVEILPVFTDETSAPWTQGGGRNSVRSCIAELGARFLGTLIPSSNREMNDIPAWIAWLAKFKRPVVWFDRHGEDLDVSPSGGCYVCRFSETRGVEVAVEALHELGHRCIAFPNSKGSYESWAGARMRLFEKTARERHPGMRCLYKDKVRYPWTERVSRDKVLARWKRKGLPHVRRILGDDSGGTLYRDYRSSLLYNTAVLMPYLSDPELTALVAPNDVLAKEYYIWLVAAGLRVPGDMSLVSFDNSPTLHPFPIASVDFGFAHLGYAAFHLLFRDIPISHSRGVVHPRARLVFRRSLGKPRAGQISADLRGDWW